MKKISWYKILHPWAKALRGAPLRAIIMPVVIMLLTGIIAAYLVGQYRSSLIFQRRNEVQSKVDEIASHLTSRINARFAILNGLSGMIKIHLDEGLSQEHYHIYAQGLADNDPAIRSIEFYMSGGETYIYPRAGNETDKETFETLIHSSSPAIAADIQRAILSREITLSDPYTTAQGGIGIAARLAVFEKNELLGIAQVVLDQAALLDIPGVTTTEAGVQYSIRDRQGKTFFGNEQAFSGEPVLASIILPEGNWTLAAAPVGGWEKGLESHMVTAWVIAAILTLVSAHLSFFIFNNQIVLQRAVHEQTAALLESEARYVQTFAVIRDGIWEWDLEKQTGFASNNCSTILGTHEKSFTGLYSWLDYLLPEDRVEAENQLERAVRAGKGFNIQARLLREKDQPVHVLIRGRVVSLDSAGRAARYLGTISDVTEDKKADEILRESEGKFRAIFNNNHVVMILIDPETTGIIDANPAACDFYGWTREELTAKIAADLSIQDPKELKIALEDEIKGNRPWILTRHRMKDGGERHVEIFSGPITHNGRKILFCIINDISARRNAEQSLLESENRLRFALEGANDGLWDMNIQTSELYVSPRAYEILEYSSSDAPALKNNWEWFTNSEDRTIVDFLRDQHFKGLTDIFEIDQRLKTKSGGWKWVQIRGKLVERDAEGRPLRMTGTLTDITLRKQAEEKMNSAQDELKRLLDEADASRKVLLSMLEDQKTAEEKLSQINASLEQRVRERTIQLETANNELEAFSYSVSHDLRAPLRGIDGWSLALLEDYGDRLDEKGQLYLTRVRSETQRMGDLIDDLLRLSRVTRMELNRVEVDLSEQAGIIAGRLQETFLKNRPEFVIQPGLKAFGDAHLLEIVMTNLLSNACKFSAMRPAPRIEFGQTAIDGRNAFFVRDNGVGFDSANAGKLFGAFQRMHKASEFPGNGIGLATVKRVINRHGGQVWADARRDQGATFYFTLPERE